MSLPWQFVGFIPQGPKGDRILITAQREAPNSYVTLYGQLQTWDVGTGAYINQGAAEALTEVYDGWVHVGFYLPSVVDNGDGTATFWRQWYCRESAESNVFNAEGAPESMGTVNLPIGPRGPVGGHYLITSTNPQPNIAYFFRRYAEWNEVAEEWDYSETIEQFGGIEAPPGPQGETGDFYELLAENPIGQNDTVVLYRQRRDGTTEAIVGQPEQIGSAVAVQGPVGPQGPQGPAGGIQGGSVSWAVFDATEFQKLSWLARKLTEMMAAQVEAVARSVSMGLNLSGNGFSLIGLAAGLIVASPIGAALAVTGAGIASIFASLADVDVQLHLEPFRTEAGIDAIAKELYCSLIPYRYLDQASIDAWIAANATGDQLSLILNDQQAEATRVLLAKSWQTWTYDQIVSVIVSILLQYEYNPAFDYTSLPCTPDLGGGQTVYDFEIDAQGWAVRAPFPEGEYVAGQGWRGQTNSFYPNNRTVHVWINFPELKTITHVEVLATDVDFIDGEGNSSFRIYMGDWQQVLGGAGHKPEGALVNWVPTLADPFTTDWLGISMVLTGLTPAALIKRISVTFAE